MDTFKPFVSSIYHAVIRNAWVGGDVGMAYDSQRLYGPVDNLMGQPPLDFAHGSDSQAAAVSSSSYVGGAGDADLPVVVLRKAVVLTFQYSHAFQCFTTDTLPRLLYVLHLLKPSHGPVRQQAAAAAAAADDDGSSAAAHTSTLSANDAPPAGVRTGTGNAVSSDTAVEVEAADDGMRVLTAGSQAQMDYFALLGIPAHKVVKYEAGRFTYYAEEVIAYAIIGGCNQWPFLVACTVSHPLSNSPPAIVYSL
jgi:hypothetical protein